MAFRKRMDEHQLGRHDLSNDGEEKDGRGRRRGQRAGGQKKRASREAERRPGAKLGVAPRRAPARDAHCAAGTGMLAGGVWNRGAVPWARCLSRGATVAPDSPTPPVGPAGHLRLSHPQAAPLGGLSSHDNKPACPRPARHRRRPSQEPRSAASLRGLHPDPACSRTSSGAPVTERQSTVDHMQSRDAREQLGQGSRDARIALTASNLLRTKLRRSGRHPSSGISGPLACPYR